MRFRAALTDPTDIDRAVAYPADGPVEALSADKIREELAENRFRPEWIWCAEDENGEILARALWWGRADSERPIALDCLQVRESVADPAGVAAALLAAGHEAFGNLPLYNVSLPGDWRTRPDLVEAVAWRQEAAYRAGLTREIERLRYEWTLPQLPPGVPPADGTAEPTGRLVFREGTDEEFLEAFVRLSAGSLDLATQHELRSMDAEQLAREDMEFYLDCPGERSWWRLADLPDGTLAGMAIPSATPYHRNVGYLGVVPEQRGRGLIDEILAEITRFHAAAGAERITATTDTVNVPMAAAFDRAGYEVTEIRLVLEAQEV
ncbi:MULTISPECIES: GNAT family N-acetyltransferase [unclassified Streptomyces]|uniref:GNAT family N-acetyltransferase n=1 Tax=Streptomyces sp. R33 TaxID=3238629 RepID=A0AB39Y505_9ACTN|nr:MULTISPECIES: GNAT family N-acetyltransferase [unclassified Streptomyces]THA34986.1 GNAT family N-acetyltransferase [Streptomyces sp. A1547]